jgi:hypothetical protein
MNPTISAVLRNLSRSLKPTGMLVLDVMGKEVQARTWKKSVCTDLAGDSLVLQRLELLDGWSRVHSDWTLIKDGRAKTYNFE